MKLEEPMPSQNHRGRKGWRFIATLALAAAALCFTSHQSLVQLAQAQEGMQSAAGVPVKNEAGDMECVSYCSVTQPGTPQMEVKWRLVERSLNERELRATAGQQSLEATVYAEGFERGQYAVVSAMKPKSIFRKPGKVKGIAPTAQPQSKLPGLEKLTITDVATRLDTPKRPHMLAPPKDTSAEWMVVRLEGVNPGMQYTYRVPGTKSVIACQAVTCPVDRIAAPAPRKPKPTPTPR